MGTERKQSAGKVLLADQTGPKGSRQGNGQLDPAVIGNLPGRKTQGGLIVGIDRWLYTVPLRLRSLFRRHRVESELDEELSYHVDRQTQEGIAHGLTPQEARRRALLAMDGL